MEPEPLSELELPRIIVPMTLDAIPLFPLPVPEFELLPPNAFDIRYAPAALVSVLDNPFEFESPLLPELRT